MKMLEILLSCNIPPLACFEFEEDEKEYYDNAMISCGWEEITEEEFNENS